MVINLPQITFVNDYHELYESGVLEFTLRQLHPRLRIAEAGFHAGSYLAVIYEGRKPSRNQVLKLVMDYYGKDFSFEDYLRIYDKIYNEQTKRWETE